MGHNVLFYFTLASLACLASAAAGFCTYWLEVMAHVDATGRSIESVFNKHRAFAIAASGIYLGVIGALLLFVGLGLVFDSLSIEHAVIVSICLSSLASLFARRVFRFAVPRVPSIFPHADAALLIQEKMTMLERELILETRPEEKFRIRQQILELKAAQYDRV